MEKHAKRVRILNLFYLAICAFALAMFCLKPVLKLSVTANVNGELISTLMNSNKDGDQGPKETSVVVLDGAPDIGSILGSLPDMEIPISIELKPMDLLAITLAKTPEEKGAIVNDKVVAGNIDSIVEILGEKVAEAMPAVLGSVVTETITSEISSQISSNLGGAELNEAAAAKVSEEISTAMSNALAVLTPASGEKPTVEDFCDAIVDEASDAIDNILAAATGDNPTITLPEGCEDVLNGFKEAITTGTDLTDGVTEALNQFGLVDQDGKIDVANAMGALLQLIPGFGGDEGGQPQPESKVVGGYTRKLEEGTDPNEAIKQLIGNYVTPELLATIGTYATYVGYAYAVFMGFWALFAVALIIRTLSKKKTWVTNGPIFTILALVTLLFGLIFTVINNIGPIALLVTSVDSVNAMLPAQVTTYLGYLNSFVIKIDSAFLWVSIALLAKWVVSWFYNPNRRKAKRELRKLKKA